MLDMEMFVMISEGSGFGFKTPAGYVYINETWHTE